MAGLIVLLAVGLLVRQRAGGRAQARSEPLRVDVGIALILDLERTQESAVDS